MTASELYAIANTGLHYDKDAYARERNHKVLELSDEAQILRAYEGDVSHMSPAAGVDLAVFREGRVLFIKRRDNGLWAPPPGSAQVGETLREAAEREFLEELGGEARATDLLAILDLRLWRSGVRFQLYHHIFLGELAAGVQPALNQSGEGSRLRLSTPRSLPKTPYPSFTQVTTRGSGFFQLYNRERATPYID